MHDWLHQIVDHAAIGKIIDVLREGEHVLAEGAWGSAGHLVAGAIARRAGRPVLLVVAHLDEADEAVEDLSLYEGLDAVGLSALEVMPGETNVSLELLADRLAVTGRLLKGDQPHVLVAPIAALMQAVPMREAMTNLMRDLKRGDTCDQAELVHWLAGAGYERVDVVEEPGDFAVRGGIVDVCPPGNLTPVRIDFFGDQIDEIAEVDLDSMASGRKLPGVRLIGASAEQIQSDERTTSIWSMLGADTIIVQHETLEIAEQARGYYERLTDATGIYSPGTVNKAFDKFAIVHINQFAAPGMAKHRITLPVRALPPFEHDAKKAVVELGEMTAEQDIVVLCQREAERARLGELIDEHTPGSAKSIALEVGYLYRGFIWSGELGVGNAEWKGKEDAALRTPNSAVPAPHSELAIVPHHEMLHRYGAKRRIRRVSAARAVDTFLDIEPGDFVVHQHHGIAKFQGLRSMRKEGDGEEYLTLEFAEKALLHVPASQIELVHKYVGGFAGRPPLSKLGGTRWRKQKEAVAESVKDLAAELLRVQAARASMPGIRYPDETMWMKQFEAEFPYDETEDQLAAMVEIRKDMADPQPMDRLICGDVGYGKTELAMRAAFRAVEAGKQVAVLCPTTVLSDQHERTFRERMADYPVKIETLNRFRTTQQVRDTLAGLAEGRVDIVIGTHRILSDDLYFKDLGMVIVDEEQKFGVEHKNRLMRFRVTVDVLTLSATPIPRTLHMALLGLRDISSLSTPPAERRAVVTEVIPYEKQRIRHAILREINRGGQCYFVHNRVGSIYDVAADLKTLVPEARFVVGHGQMPGHELEDVMLEFIRGEADVLVCTTIIESGIDIPTANTMFIADCDRFGLAEMHQLRGRVGRYKHRAYCYLLLPESRPLSEVAQRRLRAIEEFSMLGAGFKIAMRDMEIRGVGNILGAEQSGHIASVGYEMYCQLLEHATSDLKNDHRRAPVQTHLELGLSGHLPRPYIPSDKHRMDAYRRINRAGDFEVLAAVERELVEAYGPLPKPAQLLVTLAEIRAALAQLDVMALKLDGDDLIFSTHHVQKLSPMLAGAAGSVRLVDTPAPDKPGTVYYRPPRSYIEQPTTLLAVLRKLLVAPLKAAPVKSPV
ncbi:MAG: transcription-repair coupling factor [Planctomycetes bacterium]|nr:transcription-repair coupling factor [Planctomycetota bacterium]